MRIQKEKLLLIAGAIWLAAGASVVLVGIDALSEYAGWKLMLAALGALGVFTLFHVRVFSPMARRNEERIRSYEEKLQSPLRFSDKRGYLIMGFMMTLGFGGRMLGLFPDAFIAFFYPGLGFALAVTGFGFVLRYFGKEWDICKPLKRQRAS